MATPVYYEWKDSDGNAYETNTVPPCAPKFKKTTEAGSVEIDRGNPCTDPAYGKCVVIDSEGGPAGRKCVDTSGQTKEEVEKAKEGRVEEGQKVGNYKRMSKNFQCFLMDIASQLAKNEFKPYGTSDLQLRTLSNANPAAFISELEGKTGVNALFSARPKDYAALYPKVQLYKVIPPENNPHDMRKAKQVPIHFTSHTVDNSTQQILTNRSTRGDDVNLKSFSFDFRNQNIEMSTRLVECRLVLTMQNAESLRKERKTTSLGSSKKEEKFRYIDLFLRSPSGKPKKRATHSLHFDAPYYRLKAVVGWEVPPNGERYLNPKFIAQIKRSRSTMFLELKNYDLNFKENGSLELTIDYVAFIEAEFEGPRYDIFQSFDKKLDRKLIEINRELDIAAENLDEWTSAYSQEFIDEAIRKSDAQRYRSPTEIAAEDQFTESEKFFIEGQRADEAGGYLERHSAFVYAQQKKEHTAKHDKLSMHATMLEQMLDNGKLKYLDVPDTVLNGWARFKYFFSGGAKGDGTDGATPSWLLGPIHLLSAAEKQRFEAEKINHLISEQRKALEKFVPTSDGPDPSDRMRLNREVKRYLDWMQAEGTGAWLNHLSSGKYTGASKGLKSVDTYVNELQAAAEDSVNQSNDKTDARLKEAVRKLYKQNALAEGRRSGGEAYTRINYFFLGDLFATVLGESGSYTHIDKALKESKIMIVLGPYLDYRVHPNGTAAKSDVKSIGDIPIALEAYIDWYNSKAVSEGRTKWTLKTFIRDVLSDLVIPNLGIKCNPANSANIYEFEEAILSLTDMKKVTANSKEVVPKIPFKSPTQSGTRRPSISDLNVGNLNKNSSKTTYTDLVGKDVKGIVQVKDMTNYLFLYVSNYGTDKLSGNYKSDQKSGIYHFIMGNDVGLLRGIKFKKAKMKYAAELQTERSMESNARSSMQLWRKFDVDLDLIGNTLLKPGMLIYIQPKMTGLGDPSNPNSEARLLGLGGYYLITRVDNTIDSSGWKTNVSAQWQGDPVGSSNKESFFVEKPYADPIPASNIDSANETKETKEATPPKTKDEKVSDEALSSQPKPEADDREEAVNADKPEEQSTTSSEEVATNSGQTPALPQSPAETGPDPDALVLQGSSVVKNYADLPSWAKNVINSINQQLNSKIQEVSQKAGSAPHLDVISDTQHATADLRNLYAQLVKEALGLNLSAKDGNPGKDPAVYGVEGNQNVSAIIEHLLNVYE